MTLEKARRAINTIKASNGFTLMEALLAVFFLGLLATAVSTVYSSGLQSLDEQADRMLLDSRLRSRMERLVGAEFSSLSDGSEVVTVRGRNYTLTWTVVNVDLDGDATPESTAKQVTVSVTGLPDRSLTTILVDNEGRIGKIS
jgi:Tfp pilus assembly protein PilE